VEGRAPRVARMCAPAATVILICVGCVTDDEENEPAMSERPVAAGLPAEATVTYAFQDSSVPPPYHRSFVLTADRNEAHIVVDSYGTVLADRTAPMPPGIWTRLSQTFGDLSGIAVEEPAQGCTGGTGFTLTISAGESAEFELDGSACGGANSDAEDRVAAWIHPVRDLFPPMARLAPDGPG